jgi:predicted dehydrogenase
MQPHRSYEQTLPTENPMRTPGTRPIVIIGGGGIVRDAHLPAYRKGGLEVAAIIDRDPVQATRTAQSFGIPCSGSSIPEVLARSSSDVIFDIAVPAQAILNVLEQLPNGARVLIQKPMGNSLAEAESILALCLSRGFTAAVNFQLRWAPNMVAARNLYDCGILGQISDLEVQVSVHTPWDLWSFLNTAPRLEILYHSIHYVDLVRSWLGEPQRVYARTVRNPHTPQLAATKSVIVLDYGDWTRALIATNHSQRFSPAHQHSYVQWEGTDNAMRAQMGVNLDYPKGRPDTLELLHDPDGAGPKSIQLVGNWFPDAFLGSMMSLQRFVAGETTVLPTRVEDAIQTMRVVEAAYRSSLRGGESLPVTAN